MPDEEIAVLRPWRERKPSELRTVEHKEVIREELPPGYQEALDHLKSRMEALEDAHQSVLIRTAEIERRPHLTADDVKNLGEAADARAQRAIEQKIMPMIQALRDEVSATSSLPATVDVAPRAELLSSVIEDMLPVVKGLEKEGVRLNQGQADLATKQGLLSKEIARIRQGMEQLQADQLEVVVAALKDQRKAIAEKTALLQVGND